MTEKFIHVSAIDAEMKEEEMRCFPRTSEMAIFPVMNEDGGERNVSSAVSMSRKGSIRLSRCSIILEKKGCSQPMHLFSILCSTLFIFS